MQAPTTFEETVERLGTAIRLGLLSAGDRLPPERELADQLGISRSTLRHAITTLTQSGHLVSLRGRAGGTFVADAPPLAEAREVIALEGRWRDLLDYRIAIEAGAALLAAERAQPAALARMQEQVEAMERRSRTSRLPPRRRVLSPRARRGGRVVAPGGAMTEVQGGMSELIAHIAHPPAVLERANRQHERLIGRLRQGDGARRAARARAPAGHRAHPRRPAPVTPDAPLIGICAALEHARWGAWDGDAFLLAAHLRRRDPAAGAIALMLPPDALVTAEPDRLLDLLDGLILAGGRDIDPVTYGEEPHPETDESRPERDTSSSHSPGARWSATCRSSASAAACR